MRENLYGRNPVHESLRAGRRTCFKLVLARGVQEKGVLADILDRAKRAKVPVQRVERRELDKLVRGPQHQGVALEASGYPYVDLDHILALAEQRDESPWLLFLDCLQDPQNMGTLLRTAEVVGVHGVVFPSRRSAQVTPAVVSASSGACEHLYIAQVTNLARTMGVLKERDLWFAGLENVPDAPLLWETDLGGPIGIVVGSEGSGMRRLVRENCDYMVRLPVLGQVNSLNAAVAGSVALFEVARQRKETER